MACATHGLTNSPATFQRAMDKILSGIKGKFCNVYLDDIVIYTSGDFKEHLRHLDEVFQRLRDYNMKIKITKCKFSRRQVEFLGHTITKEGLSPQKSKIEAVQKISTPRNRTDVRSFLGLVGYYRRFISKYSEIARPLYHLTSDKNQFVWTEDCEQAMQILKERLSTSPILVQPDFSKPFILHTDASGVAIAGILTQLDDEGHERVIEYASRLMKKAEMNYNTTEKECLAIVVWVRKFRPYLYG
jgi:hypothetical protein